LIRGADTDSKTQQIRAERQLKWRCSFELSFGRRARRLLRLSEVELPVVHAAVVEDLRSQRSNELPITLVGLTDVVVDLAGRVDAADLETAPTRDLLSDVGVRGVEIALRPPSARQAM